MQWLTRQGPFWEDARLHSSDDYLECNGEIVTDTAVGEAAICCIRGNKYQLASATPSSWAKSPISVKWVPDDGPTQNIDVINHCNADQLRVTLQSAPVPIMSWDELEKVARARCTRLVFSADSFTHLNGFPFSVSSSRHVFTLLVTLDRFKRSFDENGQRTPEGQRLYQDHFTGDNAWFSDSSDSEKATFEKQLTFCHPSISGASLFCPWHGKERSSLLRVHFSWPVSASEPLYVVYIGPKRTKH